MNNPQPTKHAPKTESASKEPSKQPWHRPTVTFVPLKVTTFAKGSGGDGSSSSESV